jgi:hypothetical protein
MKSLALVEEKQSLDDVTSTPIRERLVFDIKDELLASFGHIEVYGFGEMSFQAFKLLKNLGQESLYTFSLGFDFSDHEGEYRILDGVTCFITPLDDTSPITNHLGHGIFVAHTHQALTNKLIAAGFKENREMKIPLANGEIILNPDIRPDWETLESAFAGLNGDLIERDYGITEKLFPEGLPSETLVTPYNG